MPPLPHLMLGPYRCWLSRIQLASPPLAHLLQGLRLGGSAHWLCRRRLRGEPLLLLSHRPSLPHRASFVHTALPCPQVISSFDKIRNRTPAGFEPPGRWLAATVLRGRRFVPVWHRLWSQPRQPGGGPRCSGRPRAPRGRAPTGRHLARYTRPDRNRPRANTAAERDEFCDHRLRPRREFCAERAH